MVFFWRRGGIRCALFLPGSAVAVGGKPGSAPEAEANAVVKADAAQSTAHAAPAALEPLPQTRRHRPLAGSETIGGQTAACMEGGSAVQPGAAGLLGGQLTAAVMRSAGSGAPALNKRGQPLGYAGGLVVFDIYENKYPLLV